MNKGIKFLCAALAGFALVSCGSAKKMAEQAENVIATCNPAVLEVVAGNIDANVTVTYPADYFHPKAILAVTPVIVYQGGEQAMEPIMFQGEKVKDNYEVVPSEGATITKPVHFKYVPGMEKCYLELRGVATFKGTDTDLPSKKVADGCNTTYMLVCQNGTVNFKADEYQAIIKQTAEGQILYNINSADVKNSELKSESIKNFQDALDEIKANERKTLVGTQVVAYASPDGGESLNAKLSDKRAGTAEKAFAKVTKKKDIDSPEVSSVGQDWEGFQQLVAESNIEDKDLIIRVLSMYSDPAVREKEIKNMSAVYTTLAKEVLPELRRARFIANVEYKNYTSEELLTLVDENIDVLDEEALLHVATLVTKAADKASIYKKAADKFNSNRAKFNQAVVALQEGDYKEAKKLLAGCEKDADYQNAMGIIALNEGDYLAASRAFAASGNADSKANQAVIDILNGNYKEAASKLAGSKGCNAALAQLLSGNYAAATAAACDCPKGSYIKAIAAARQGKTADAAKYLETAKKDAELAKKAATDVEFAAVK